MADNTRASYWFPNTLKSDDFALRKMTIGVYGIKTLAGTTKELAAKVLKAGSEVLSGEFNSAEKVMTDFNGEIITSISLPIPNELQDEQSHQWTVDTGFTKMAMDHTGLGAIQDGIAAKAFNLAGKNKILGNPGYFQNYTGSEPRTFTFTYNFIPNNSAEADELIKIITLLKKYSSPTPNAGILLTAPNFFNVKFGNETLQKLTNIRPCIIQDISVNYSGSGFLETTMDGMPKHLILNITFAEISAITSADWQI